MAWLDDRLGVQYSTLSIMLLCLLVYVSFDLVISPLLTQTSVDITHCPLSLHTGWYLSYNQRLRVLLWIQRGGEILACLTFSTVQGQDGDIWCSRVTETEEMDHCIFKGQQCVCVNLMFDTHLSCIPDHYTYCLSSPADRSILTDIWLERREMVAMDIEWRRTNNK